LTLPNFNQIFKQKIAKIDNYNLLKAKKSKTANGHSKIRKADGHFENNTHSDN